MGTRKRFLPTGWYPNTEVEILEFLKENQKYINNFSQNFKNVSSAIIPHAGWYFSGKLVAKVLNICQKHSQPDLIVFLGGHLNSETLILYNNNFWETPLGNIELENKYNSVLEKHFKVRYEGPQTSDNTIEVSLPLIKHYFPNTKVWPFRVSSRIENLELLNILNFEENKVLFIASTDLTHYGENYAFSPKGLGQEAWDFMAQNDTNFLNACLSFNYSDIISFGKHNNAACSSGAALLISKWAEIYNCKGEIIDYYSSRHIMESNSAVGYGGLVFGQ